MSLAESAVSKRKLTYFVTLLLVVAGMASYTQLGQLEDPEFTVKTAAVITQYPGASPEEVEQEVTEVLELKLQELAEVDYLESISRAGISYITIEIKSHHHSREIPQIFDLIRNKVHDATPSLPPQALAPVVADDVGQIFGLLLAIVGDGFSPKELADYADDVKRQLSLVSGVSRVDLWGDQDEAIYIEVSESRSHQLGISPQTLLSTLASQNFVVNSGALEINDQRLRIETTGSFTTPEEIENLVFRASPLDQLGNELPSSPDTLVRLKDFATVRRALREPPSVLMRYDGKPAVALAASVASGSNVVDIGRALDKRLEELKLQLPIGIEFHKVAWQSDLVEESIISFMISLAQAVLIVLVVLWFAMGVNNALIIGSALLLTILGSFIVMGQLGINLERMSLGALVIALGMMVDNAIVVADGATVYMQQGMDRVKAAVRAAATTATPLLGATIIAVSFFYPVYGSTESTGEYCASLFLVVGISLLLSWVISMTITPLQCVSMIKIDDSEGKDPYAGKLFQAFKGILTKAIRFRWLTMGIALGALVLSVMAFPLVPKMFFPDASRLQFMVDYWAPEGTRIQQVSDDLAKIEEYYLDDPRVTGVASFIGAGPPRFYLPVEPQKPNHAYAQIIVNVRSLSELDAIIADSRKWFSETLTQAEARTRKFAVGPGEEFKFEARISGPGNVPLPELRQLGDQGVALLQATPLAKDVRTNWRERTKKVVASYQQDKGRWTQISRTDMSRDLQRAYDGFPVGQYREGDDLIPIVVRAVEEERQSLGNLEVLQIGSQFNSRTVPLAQVATLAVDTEDPMIWRRDRKRTITVQAEPSRTLGELRSVVAKQFEEMPLPPGYQMEWGGEFESSRDSQAALVPSMLPVCIIVALMLIALFNAYRAALVIVLTIPFAAIGVVLGLLITRAPFGFMALLGAMSLAGMMIKNVIVLLDQVNVELSEGRNQFDAIIMAALSRLRPVCLAAATTILGVVPLLQDVFWVSMAVVIMGGLAVGTVLTMIVAPVLYAILYRVHEVKEPAPWPPQTAEESPQE